MHASRCSGSCASTWGTRWTRQQRTRRRARNEASLRGNGAASGPLDGRAARRRGPRLGGGAHGGMRPLRTAQGAARRDARRSSRGDRAACGFRGPVARRGRGAGAREGGSSARHGAALAGVGHRDLASAPRRDLRRGWPRGRGLHRRRRLADPGARAGSRLADAARRCAFAHDARADRFREPRRCRAPIGGHHRHLDRRRSTAVPQ